MAASSPASNRSPVRTMGSGSGTSRFAGFHRERFCSPKKARRSQVEEPGIDEGGSVHGEDRKER
jgi:hypothetical protein